MKQVLKKGFCYIGLIAMIVSMLPGGHKTEASAAQSYQSAIERPKKKRKHWNCCGKKQRIR